MSKCVVCGKEPLAADWDVAADYCSARCQYIAQTRGMSVPGVGPDAPTIITEKGGKHSDSPYRVDLLDPRAILKAAAVMKKGAEKYGEENWRGNSARTHVSHLLNHAFAWLAGDRSDDHLSHAVCRAIMACAKEIEGEKSA